MSILSSNLASKVCRGSLTYKILFCTHEKIKIKTISSKHGFPNIRGEYVSNSWKIMANSSTFIGRNPYVDDEVVECVDLDDSCN